MWVKVNTTMSVNIRQRGRSVWLETVPAVWEGSRACRRSVDNGRHDVGTQGSTSVNSWWQWLREPSKHAQTPGAGPHSATLVSANIAPCVSNLERRGEAGALTVSFSLWPDNAIVIEAVYYPVTRYIPCYHECCPGSPSVLTAAVLLLCCLLLCGVQTHLY